MDGSDDDHWWRKPLQRPRRLHSGDRVAAVTPSWGGPGKFPERYAVGKIQLAGQFGLEVVETAHARRDPEWLDRNPEARADDLMQAFDDPAIKAVIATIGGSDAIRLIPHLDLKVIRDNPKLFVGYSDATAIHFACLKAGVGTLHGPTIMSGFAENGGMSHLTINTFRQMAFETVPMGEFPPNVEGWTVEHLPWDDSKNQEKARRRAPSCGIQRLRGSGRVRGPLIGGCAEVLEMIKATPWWPPVSYWDGAILFYETSEEAPGPGLVLRWLRNLSAQGILQRVSGLLLGRPGGQMDDADRVAQKASVLKALDEAGLFNLPVLADLDIGHTDPIGTLPYGVMAELDCDMGSLRILEPAVVD